ncbi:MAG: hypothetical protein KGL18_18485 [Burkholderiales bacterium]|nr:hypothetical protein [Burkholderiales bacterium]MDE1927642.1 hypothetical protein [Burkholderiales bacterium]MDE2158891.1 hypothetical protein [Burkholderiales bacterium]MDE2504956.1 hypothetical protein [Burkholderiales bacterium]
MNKPLLSAVFTACALFAGHSFAAGSCADQAAAKKLNGAAKTSFVKKCEKTTAAPAAASACMTQAAGKKLKGAAKNSFVKKCEKDAGAAAK